MVQQGLYMKPEHMWEETLCKSLSTGVILTLSVSWLWYKSVTVTPLWHRQTHWPRVHWISLSLSVTSLSHCVSLFVLYVCSSMFVSFTPFIPLYLSHTSLYCCTCKSLHWHKSFPIALNRNLNLIITINPNLIDVFIYEVLLTHILGNLLIPWYHSCLYASQVNSSEFYLHSPASQVCLKGLYSLYSIWHPLSIEPLFR